MSSPPRFIVSIHATLMVEVLLQMNWKKIQTKLNQVSLWDQKLKVHLQLQYVKTTIKFTCTLSGEKRMRTSDLLN